ncbi:xaa-Pro aminopeptidase-like protein I [Calycina marina]|uniref:Xaa-Pro aminopeptidase n=1 Tax=Calycina marina TaxID=1763456 RepID=A0A9P7Z3E5_9HELO|nr:xaa-Pro aminopeptidase-like protein I [Calycina marina]
MAYNKDDEARGRTSRSDSCSTDWSCIDVDEFDALFITANPKPDEKYPAKLHSRKVAKHLGEKHGLIYLPGLPTKLYEDSDNEENFRQRRYFFYLSGMNIPDCAVTYNIYDDVLTAFIPPQNSGREVMYQGQKATQEEVKVKYDVDEVLLITSLTDHLNHFAHKDLGKIFVLNRRQAPHNLVAQNLGFWEGRNNEPPEVQCSASVARNRCATCARFNQECVIPQANAEPLTYHPEVAPEGYYMHRFPELQSPFSHQKTSPFDFSRLAAAMNASRVIKTPFELKLMRKANAISAAAHKNVLRAIKFLDNESEIEAIFTGVCITLHAKQQSYGVIAASGENASTLHYVANNESLKGRQLVCLDAGCDWQCYASDVTRTFPISGKFTKESKEIYDIVEEMQESCIKMVRPGTNFRDVHINAHEVAVRGLMKLGILHSGSFDDILKSGASVAFFLHGLGHYMGLEVHDVGDGGALLSLNRIQYDMSATTLDIKQPQTASPAGEYNMLYGMTERAWLKNFHEILKEDILSPTSILAPNQVITVEPGIYFSRYALGLFLENKDISKYINVPLLDKYYAVGGVRIEDDILVTEDGYENLTTAPKGQAALDIINDADADEGHVRMGRKWFT